MINILLGPKPLSSLILLEAIVDYVSAQERLFIKEALLLSTASKSSDNIQQKVLNILSRFGCRQLPINIQEESSAQYFRVQSELEQTFNIYYLFSYNIIPDLTSHAVTLA